MIALENEIRDQYFFALESKLRKKFDGAANLVRKNKGRTKKKREEEVERNIIWKAKKFEPLF